MVTAERKSASDSSSALSIPKKLSPEEPKVPLTSRAWKMDDGSWFHLAELPHNHDACDPNNSCNSIVSVKLTPGSFSEKLAYCKSCKEPVTVNLSMICFELKLNTLRSTLIVPNPHNNDEIVKNRETIRQEIEGYHAMLEAQEKSAELLRQSWSVEKWLKT